MFTCTVSSCCSGPEVDTDSSVELLTYWNTLPMAVNDEVTCTLYPPFKIACPWLSSATNVKNYTLMHILNILKEYT